METRSDLATGHARTANARSRMRNGWEDIARDLNSDGNGCVKDWKQWAKYWKDKKASVKRKANTAEAARQRTGGGVDAEVVELNELEQRILTIVGGPSFATGDRHLSINPFPETANTGTVPQSSNESESILVQGIVPGPSGAHSHSIIVDEDGMQLEWDNTAAAVLGEGSVHEALESPSAAQRQRGSNIDDVLQDEDETVFLDNDSITAASPERESPSTRADGARGEGRAPRSILVETPRQQAGRRRSLPSQRGSGGSPSRRRVLRGARTRGGASAARRRLLRRSPPSQRRSEMASLTERFIAIEERRVDAELAIAQSQEMFVQAYRMTAEALNRLTSTIDNVAPQIVEAIQQSRVQH